MTNYKIYCEDCIEGSKKYIENESVDLIICDPPFGINEASFDRHYKRTKKDLVIDGYVEAPKNYYEFSYRWISEAKRILKHNGSFYIISGWSKLHDILRVIDELDLVLQNHIIWKFNFGVFTKTKYVTSHYHVLYILKSNKSKPVFNTYCRYGNVEKDLDGKSLNYKDREDVWVINKEFHPNKKKNKNKLPNKLIEKIIMYSSNEGDIVCDFFQGNFTSASCSIELGRIPIGFEMNKESYDYNMRIIKNLEFGSKLSELRTPIVDLPKNQGKKITEEERFEIIKEYNRLSEDSSLTKKNKIASLCEKFARGKFSIINILEKGLTNQK